MILCQEIFLQELSFSYLPFLATDYSELMANIRENGEANDMAVSATSFCTEHYQYVG